MDLKKKLQDWYKKNKRDLPWRKTMDPYKIWVSEIILQQTRVNQGIEYYKRFIKKFPTVDNLAFAQIDEVMLLWKGLGYYSRARNMYEAAKQIVNHFNGKFPEKFNELLKLKGIGKYTAGAIASIAFNQPVPVIDGNVIRVYSRLFNIFQPFTTSAGKKILEKIAVDQLDTNNPGDYNQAIMEFGALHCTPHKPSCANCIFKNNCQALLLQKVGILPVKSKTIKTKTRFFNYLVLYYKNYIYLQKRTGKDIWNSLYQFPVLETYKKAGFNEIINHIPWKKYLDRQKIKLMNESDEIKHKLTHQTIRAKFYHIMLENRINNTDWTMIDMKDIDKLAVPRLIDQYWKKFLNKI